LQIFATACIAQVNVEDKRMERDASGLSGSINLSLELQRGNSELTKVGLKPRLVYRTGPSQWFILNSYSFVDTKQGSIVNEGFTHLRYNYSATDRIILEALTQVQYNREQDLRQRILVGAGLRFVLIDRQTASLAVGFTGMFEYEELVSRQIIRTPRNSDYVALRFTATDVLTLRNTIYVQPAFDDPNDIRILNDLEASISLSSWLATTISLDYRFDSQPPSDVKHFDLTLKNGLTVKF